jgi:hypothetical protein
VLLIINSNLMKKIKFLLLSFAFFATGNAFGQTQYINIATAYDQATWSPLSNSPNPVNDPEWEVKGPSASNYSIAPVSAWGSSSNFSNWIGYTGMNPTGIYKFRVHFTPQNVYGCNALNIASARIVFDWTDADDELRKIYLNGSTTPIHDYSIMPPAPGITTSFIPNTVNGWSQSDQYSITIPAGSITPGVNTLEFEIHNTWANTVVGMNVDATIEITYSVPQSVNAGPDVTICQGSCATLTASGGGIRNHSYVWSNSTGTVGSGASISVCPTQTTTYCVTMTSGLTGCSTTDCVTVSVDNLDPNFSLTANTTNSSYLTLSATPNQTTGLPAGFGFMWFVDELNSSLAPVYSVNSGNTGLGGCWWTFPSAEVFDGFDGLTYTLSSSCLPANGQFKYNTNYRITRGVWVGNCWYQASYLILYTRSANGVAIVEDHNAPDMSGFLNNTNSNPVSNRKQGLSLYPNPANNLLNIEYKLADKVSGKILITDPVGRTLKTIVLTEGSFQAQVDISDLISGIYFVNFYESGKLSEIQKVIVAK